MKTYGYLRISNKKHRNHEDNSMGIADQDKSIRDYATKHGLVIDEIMKDVGISGATDIDERPGLSKIMGVIGKGDVLLVKKRDRLSRRSITACAIEYMIEKKGGSVIAVEDGKIEDKMTATIIRFTKDLVAEMERINGSERMKAYHKVKREKNHKRGVRAPFGWVERNANKVLVNGYPRSIDPTLVENPYEQGILKKMIDMYHNGNGATIIANWMNREKVFTSSKRKKWDIAIVLSILRKNGVKIRPPTPMKTLGEVIMNREMRKKFGLPPSENLETRYEKSMDYLNKNGGNEEASNVSAR